MRIDPTTDKIVGKTNVRGASGVEATDDAVWVLPYFEEGEGLQLQGKATGADTTRSDETRRRYSTCCVGLLLYLLVVLLEALPGEDASWYRVLP